MDNDDPDEKASLAGWMKATNVSLSTHPSVLGSSSIFSSSVADWTKPTTALGHPPKRLTEILGIAALPTSLTDWMKPSTSLGLPSSKLTDMLSASVLPSSLSELMKPATALAFQPSTVSGVLGATVLS